MNESDLAVDFLQFKSNQFSAQLYKRETPKLLYRIDLTTLENFHLT